MLWSLLGLIPDLFLFMLLYIWTGAASTCGFTVLQPSRAGFLWRATRLSAPRQSFTKWHVLPLLRWERFGIGWKMTGPSHSGGKRKASPWILNAHCQKSKSQISTANILSYVHYFHQIPCILGAPSNEFWNAMQILINKIPVFWE